MRTRRDIMRIPSCSRSCKTRIVKTGGIMVVIDWRQFGSRRMRMQRGGEYRFCPYRKQQIRFVFSSVQSPFLSSLFCGVSRNLS